MASQAAELAGRLCMGEVGRPVFRKTPAGEWRHLFPPYLVDGVNVLLTIGRGDLAFAPLPAAGDPLLLLWFSVPDVREWPHVHVDKEWQDCRGYQLILTGHSLGAGTATLLAMLLRPQFTNLHCFAYSPPGGLLSLLTRGIRDAQLDSTAGANRQREGTG